MFALVRRPLSRWPLNCSSSTYLAKTPVFRKDADRKCLWKRFVSCNSILFLRNNVKGERADVKEIGRHVVDAPLADLTNKLKDKNLKIRIKFKDRSDKIRNRSRVLLTNFEKKYKIKEKVERIIERENIWTVPNILCVTRICASPYLGYLIIQNEYNIAFYLMIFAGFTDLLDGLIARNVKSQSTKLGSFLDPLADKILVSTMFMTMTYVDLVPIALTGLIISRDIWLAAIGFYIRYKSLPPPRTLARYLDLTHATAQIQPLFISKVNTLVQLTTAGLSLTAPVFGFTGHPGLICLWTLTASTTVISAVSYVYRYKDTYTFLRKSNNKSN